MSKLPLVTANKLPPARQVKATIAIAIERPRLRLAGEAGWATNWIVVSFFPRLASSGGRFSRPADGGSCAGVDGSLVASESGATGVGSACLVFTDAVARSPSDTATAKAWAAETMS